MFASKEACVREITERILRSQLTDEEALSAVFNIIRLYRETPNAFDNCREMEEPLNISASFPWDQAGLGGSEYWKKINEALVAIFQNMTDGCDYPVCDFGEIDLNGDGSEETTTHFSSIGPIVEGWGLFDREKRTTVPAFFETRSDACELKDSNTSVVLVGLFTIDQK